MSSPFTKFPVFLQASLHSSIHFPGVSLGYMVLTWNFLWKKWVHLCSFSISVLCLVALWTGTVDHAGAGTSCFAKSKPLSQSAPAPYFAMSDCSFCCVQVQSALSVIVSPDYQSVSSRWPCKVSACWAEKQNIATDVHTAPWCFHISSTCFLSHSTLLKWK